MRVDITCKRATLTSGEQDYIKRKSEKLLTYFERVTAINVTITHDKDRIRTEIQVDAEHKHDFVAVEEGELVTTTFDLAYHKMEQQIKRYKERIQDHRRAPMNEGGKESEEEEDTEE